MRLTANERHDREAGVLSGLRLRRGFLIATSLSLLFLVATAYTSAATLLSRVQATEVMKAASQSVWSGHVATQIAHFVLAQVLLHVSFGAVAWMLACGSAVVWPTVRAKFGRIVVGWFSLLAGVAIAYNAVWYPRTLIGAHYHDTAAAVVGPLQAGQWIYYGVVAFAILVLIAAVASVLRRAAAAQRRSLATGAAAVVALAAVVTVIAQLRSSRSKRNLPLGHGLSERKKTALSSQRPFRKPYCCSANRKSRRRLCATCSSW